MEIARKWNTSPMRVVGGSKTLWFVREEAVRDCEIKRGHRRELQAKQQADEIARARRKR
jgi:hypothetical protein